MDSKKDSGQPVFNSILGHYANKVNFTQRQNVSVETTTSEKWVRYDQIQMDLYFLDDYHPIDEILC